MKTHPLTFVFLTAAIAGVFAADKKTSDYHPAIDPANFTHVIDHPYFPLVPGTTFNIVEKEGRETRENTITVTHDTKTVMGSLKKLYRLTFPKVARVSAE